MSSQRARRARILKLMAYLLAAAAGASIAMSVARLVLPLLGASSPLGRWLGNWLPDILPGVIGILLVLAATRIEQRAQRLRSSSNLPQRQRLHAGSTRHPGIRPPRHGRRGNTSAPTVSPRVRRVSTSAITSTITTITVVAGLFLTAWSVEISQKQADVTAKQADLAARQVLQAEQSQTDELLRKIDADLKREGPSSIGLPTITTLYKIAREQDPETARAAIDILGRYLRMATAMDANDQACEPTRLTREVKKALYDLFDPRVTNVFIAVSMGPDDKIDLDRTCLFKADLNGTDLRIANLLDANLTQADLTNARLEDGNFKGTNFTDADLAYCKLYGAILTEAILAGARLSNATWDESTLWPPQLVEMIKSHSKSVGGGLYQVERDFILTK